MPLFPPINNDDVLVHGKMDAIHDAAPAANGVCNLASPISGRLKMLCFATLTLTNADITLSISTKHGSMLPIVIPSGTAQGSYHYEIPLFDRANFVDAGEAFSIQSDGGGSGGGLTHFTAVIARG